MRRARQGWQLTLSGGQVFCGSCDLLEVGFVLGGGLVTDRPTATGEGLPIPLPILMPVSNHSEPANQEQGWRAIAFRSSDGNVEFLLVKGSSSAWVPTSELTLS